MGLQDIDLKEEYRSDRNDIIAEFFYPCLRNCIKYDRCVELLSVHSLTALAMNSANFASGRAKLRLVTGHRFGTQDLHIFGRIFSEKQSKVLNGSLTKDPKIQKLQEIVDNRQIEIKIAIPNSEHVAESFSERIGIFLDGDGNRVAFTGTSQKSFSTHTSDFESVDVFTSWNDKSRVEQKVKNFEDLWINKTKYVEVYDFMYAHENHMLKFLTSWAFEH